MGTEAAGRLARYYHALPVRVGLASGVVITMLVALALVDRPVQSRGGPTKPARSASGPGAASKNVDLADPDAVIVTSSLAKLPPDLLRIPLFRDVLTEDLVFYYEHNESRLSLIGTLRRIAYEHDLGVVDWVVRSAFDEPAEIALWKGPDNRLRYFVMAMSRNHIARLLEMAARVALDDRQLSRTDLAVSLQGEEVPVYRIAYRRGHELLFAARGDRLVIISDASLLALPEDDSRPDPRATVARLLSPDVKTHSVYRDRFMLTDEPAQHTVAVAVRYLSFGYQRFFPSVQALRFDFGLGAWSTRVLFDPTALPPSALVTAPVWSMVPAGPAACAALPVNWDATASLLADLGGDAQQVPRLVAALDGPAAVCWYPTSRMYTPLFVVATKQPVDPAGAALLGRLFATVVGAREPALKEQADPRFPVATFSPAAEVQVWRRDVSSRYAPSRTVEEASGAKTARRSFQVTLARHPLGIVFSPDDSLVDSTLSVGAKRYPALRDSLSDEGRVLAVISPGPLSALLEREAFASLPASDEPTFRNAANAHLVPRLAALKRYPSYALTLSEDVDLVGGRWLPVTWRATRLP